MKYMADTVIFNRIVEGDYGLETMSRWPRLLATHIQWDEINKTSDEIKRNALIEAFLSMSESRPTESALWGISKWDDCKWASDDLCSEVIRRLDEIKKKENNKEDALIADTSMKNGMTLLTEDVGLYDVVDSLGGKVQRFAEFLEEYQ